MATKAINPYTLDRQRRLGWNNSHKPGISQKIARAFLKKYAPVILKQNPLAAQKK